MILFAGYASGREQATTRRTIFSLDEVTQLRQRDVVHSFAAQAAISSSTTSGM
jgi:hypothetical protein